MHEYALLWGIKRSFLRYLAHQPSSRASVGGGAASTTDHRFLFPASGAVDSLSPTSAGILRFEGDVRLTAYGGMLDLVVAEPWIEIDAISTRLSVVAYDADRNTLVRTVVADLTEQESEQDGSRSRHWEARLSATGAPVFGDVYVVGEMLDSAAVVPIDSSVGKM